MGISRHRSRQESSSSRTQHGGTDLTFVDRVGLIDSQSHVIVFDVDDRHCVLANLNNVANSEIKFLKFHRKPPCQRMSRSPNGRGGGL